MSGPPQTSPLVTSPTHGGPGGLPTHPVQQNKPTVFSWCADRFCDYPLLSALALYVTLTVFIIGVAYGSYNRDMRFGIDQLQDDRSGIALTGQGSVIDINNLTLSVGWTLLGCGEYGLVALSALGVTCSTFNRPVDIYLNGASEPTFSYDPARQPSGLVEGLVMGLYDGFVVDHPLHGLARDMAPFDTYDAAATMFAIDKATNETVPIITFAAGWGPKNFLVSSENWGTLSNFTYDNGTGPTTVEVESSFIIITVKRSQLARAFTICMLLINSALTAGSVYVTVLVLTKKGREGVNEGIFLFPISVVLTIPTLRSLYPGSHPFGLYIDTFGFFSQMMIVALCSMILLYAVTTSPKPGRRASGYSIVPNRTGGNP